QPQDLSKASYRAKRTPADGLVDFSLPAKDIVNLIRAVSRPFPGAYFYCHGVRVRVWKAGAYTGPQRTGVVGQVLGKIDDKLIVQAADCPVLLHDLTASGRNAILPDIRVGEVLGYRVQDMIHQLLER